MSPSAKQVHFLDLIQKDESSKKKPGTKRIINELLHRKPPFQKSRFEAFNSKISNEPPPSIKEYHKPKLDKLSMSELKLLLNKQEQILKNKKLLQNLKDQGEKVKNFYNEIQNEIDKRQRELEKSINETEMMFEELSINEIKDENTTKNSPVKIDEYSKNRTRLVDKTAERKRFNRPLKFESTIKIESGLHQNRNKEVSIKIELPREIKTLDYQESLKRLEVTTKKEKEKLREQMIRFYEYRTRDDEPEDDLDSDDDEYHFDLDYDELN